MKRECMIVGRKVLSIALAAALGMSALSGCSFKKKDKEEPSASVESSVTEASLLPEDDADQGKEPSSSGKLFTIINHNVECKAFDEVIATGKYPEIIVSEEYAQKFPKMKAILDTFNTAWSENLPNTVANYGHFKLIDNYAPDGTYDSEITLSVVRSDDKLLTLCENYYDHSGGAHPNHGVTYMNFDPATGETVRLTDAIDAQQNVTNPELFWERLYATYPDLEEEIRSYNDFTDYDTGEKGDTFVTKLEQDGFNWAILKDGLWLYFSPYEVASYATGYLEINFPYDEYPHMVLDEYRTDEDFDAQANVEFVDDENVVTIEPEEPVYEGDDYSEKEPYSEENLDLAVTLPNASWDQFVNYSYQKKDPEYVTLEKIKEEKTDWLDLEDWFIMNSIAPPTFPNSDHLNNRYNFESPVEYDYMYSELKITDNRTDEVICDYDFYTLANGPDEEKEDYSDTTQFIRWARKVDDMLYVELSISGYASEEPNSSYIVCVDTATNQVVFRTEPQTANCQVFDIVKDTIICGYGFTAEPDYIYILDRFTGERIEQIPVNSAPEHIEAADDILYVACYNTAYEFKIKDK